MECILSDKDLDSVVTEDLSRFRNLYYLDVSGNYLNFEQFGVLSSLKNLNIGCNALTRVSIPLDNINSFSKLEVSKNLRIVFMFYFHGTLGIKHFL